MELGGFSISLAVKDIEKSKAFYEKLGFTVFAGEQSHNYLIMKNGKNNIGLFQGMFEGNIITFNPGWDQDANSVEPFTDVRELLKHFKSQGLDIAQDSITGNSGPSSFTVIDPDGNSILIDQHV
ncbi:MAG: VOC family protein [Gammaproteobacteria bacterium]|nr:MAG: VOC family protein [Gammaproteobacteria bacterium]